MKYTLLAATFSIACNGMVYAEENYVAPKANKIMFHVDKLPLDKGMREKLSANLIVLAKREHDGTAREHRLTAQILMLAMRIDRDNKSAYELNKSLIDGKKLPVSDVKAKVQALDKLRYSINHLSKTDRLSEARVLEVYLKDILIGLDQNNPLTATHKENQHRWSGIVPAYVRNSNDINRPDVRQEPEPTVEQPEVTNTGEAMANTPDIVDSVGGNEEAGNNLELAPEVKKTEFTKWNKHISSISTPLILVDKVDGYDKYRTEMVALETLISPRVKLESDLSLEMKPWIDGDKLGTFRNRLKPMIKAQFGEFESLKVEVTTKGYLSTKNQQTILLPLCLQLMASEQSIEVSKGMAVLGKLDGENITRQSDFWHLLKIFRKNKSAKQRLLVPYSAEPDLKQLVALEEEDFFVNYEVILVSKVDGAVDNLGLSKNTNISEASEEFSKIQDMIGSKSVGPFAVNKKVRAKLESILSKNPNHLSAKMILLRGDVGRSKKLDTYFVAVEFSKIMTEISYLFDNKEPHIDSNSIMAKAKKMNTLVEELEQFIDADDRELAGYLTDMVDYLETISRTKEKRESIAVQRTLAAALNDFKLKYKEAKARFDEILSKPPTI
ncbi:MAG: hypothetical protein ACSHX6_03135 [Akkermansiaceae bacterium]